MLLDLSEILVCPRCRPAQGLVVLVDEIEDRRVVRGHLGCPECEARIPVEAGTVRFDAVGYGDGGPAAADTAGRPPPDVRGDDGPGGERGWAGAALFDGGSRREAALRLGALLGLPEAEGPFLLGPGLDGLAVAVAGMAEDEEVLALEGDVDPGGDGVEAADGPGGDARGDAGYAPVDAPDAARRVARLVGVPATEWPVFSGRLGGIVLLGGTAGAVEEAVRSVREGGRVVVVEPAAGLAEVAGELPVEVAARDARALVAVRRA